MLVAASWQTRVGALLSFIEYVEPDSVVGIVTVPSHLVLALPSITRSRAWRTLPERASTTTSLIDGSAPLVAGDQGLPAEAGGRLVLPDHEVGGRGVRGVRHLAAGGGDGRGAGHGRA